VAVARREANLQGDVNVLLTNDRKMRELNRRFRRKDKTTTCSPFRHWTAAISRYRFHWRSRMRARSDTRSAMS